MALFKTTSQLKRVVNVGIEMRTFNTSATDCHKIAWRFKILADNNKF